MQSTIMSEIRPLIDADDLSDAKRTETIRAIVAPLAAEVRAAVIVELIGLIAIEEQIYAEKLEGVRRTVSLLVSHQQSMGYSGGLTPSDE